MLAKTCAEQGAAAERAQRSGKGFQLAACALRLQAAAESSFEYGLNEAATRLVEALSDHRDSEWRIEYLTLGMLAEAKHVESLVRRLGAMAPAERTCELRATEGRWYELSCRIRVRGTATATLASVARSSRLPV